MNFVYVLVRTLSTAIQLSVFPGMRYVPGTGMVFAAVVTPNTCDYCYSFAATVADAGDGAWYWCCPIFTVAAAALCC